jgi:hypothetical protein
MPLYPAFFPIAFFPFFAPPRGPRVRHRKRGLRARQPARLRTFGQRTSFRVCVVSRKLLNSESDIGKPEATRHKVTEDLHEREHRLGSLANDNTAVIVILGSETESYQQNCKMSAHRAGEQPIF